MILLTASYDFENFFYKARECYWPTLVHELWTEEAYAWRGSVGYICELDLADDPREVIRLIEWCAVYDVDWDILDESDWIYQDYIEDRKDEEETYKFFLKLFKQDES